MILPLLGITVVSDSDLSTEIRFRSNITCNLHMSSVTITQKLRNKRNIHFRNVFSYAFFRYSKSNRINPKGLYIYQRQSIIITSNYLISNNGYNDVTMFDIDCLFYKEVFYSSRTSYNNKENKKKITLITVQADYLIYKAISFCAPALIRHTTKHLNIIDELLK